MKVVISCIVVFVVASTISAEIHEGGDGRDVKLKP
jgi:hypothetical protein